MPHRTSFKLIVAEKGQLFVRELEKLEICIMVRSWTVSLLILKVLRFSTQCVEASIH